MTFKQISKKYQKAWEMWNKYYFKKFENIGLTTPHFLKTNKL